MIDKDLEKERTLVENTAQAVRNHLMSFNSNRAHVITRWIWELLQNARDTSPQGDTDIVASIERRDGVLVFQHNGRDFSVKEISHLIFHGSTKAEDPGTVGQYGSGFLTTHLLSPTIEVSGRIDEGETFKFRLFREISSVEALRTSMDLAWEDFKTSAVSTPDSIKGAFTTQFCYPLDDTVVDVVEEGISSLRKCAPFVMVFNRQFDCILIEDQGNTTKFKVTRREVLQEGLQEITVERNENGEQSYGTYIIADGDKVSIAIPIRVTDNEWECLEISDIPRLFLGFPLIGTETFSFPAIINSFDFTPEENRDGVALWQNENDLANQKNQAVIEEACQLHLKLIRYAATSNSKKVHVLANIPPIRERDWLNKERFRECLGEQLIEPMRETSLVFCGHESIIPVDSRLPYTERDEGVEELWDLMRGINEYQGILPERNEAVGWRNAVDSWAVIKGKEVTDFEEVIDGTKLAEYIENKTKSSGVFGTLDNLQNMLVDGTCAVEWLNQLHQFLIDDGLDGLIKERYLVLDQDGNLDKLENLYRDDDIDDKLKDIADDLGLNCRPYLRDKRLTALQDEIGKGKRDNEDVIREITKKLKDLANDFSDDGLSDGFGKASIGSLAWLVRAEQWKELSGFPVFYQTEDTATKKALWLPQHTEDDSDIPLAPISAWPEDLQEYSVLFPPRYILADAFFEAIPDLNTWQSIAEKGFVRTSVITTKNANYNRFIPSEPLSESAEVDHKTTELVRLTNVTFFAKEQVGIMERVRRSPSRARVLWRFIIEWLSANDPKGLDPTTTSCDCEETHEYFPAEWVVRLVDNKWVPIGSDRSDKATAQSLAKLLRGEDTGKHFLEDLGVANFLRAIKVSKLNLMREVLMGESEDRDEVEANLAELEYLTLTSGNLEPVRNFLEDLQTDDNLTAHLGDRRKRLRIVHDNQRLGKRVEELVRETFEGEGFIVTPIHVGSDLKIELPEPHDVASLKLYHKNRSWFVEVKATRGDSYVRMTEAQARKAVEEGNQFLLCVIPVDAETDDLQDSDVKANMHFVENIGSRLGELHNDIDWLKSVRGEVTNKEHSGVQLEVVSGITRVKVSDSLWNSEGFPLEVLINRIK